MGGPSPGAPPPPRPPRRFGLRPAGPLKKITPSGNKRGRYRPRLLCDPDIDLGRYETREEADQALAQIWVSNFGGNPSDVIIAHFGNLFPAPGGAGGHGPANNAGL